MHLYIYLLVPIYRSYIQELSIYLSIDIYIMYVCSMYASMYLSTRAIHPSIYRCPSILSIYLSLPRGVCLYPAAHAQYPKTELWPFSFHQLVAP